MANRNFMREDLISKYLELLNEFRSSIINQYTCLVYPGNGGSITVKSVVKVDFKGHLSCYIEDINGTRFDIATMSKFNFPVRD